MALPHALTGLVLPLVAQPSQTTNGEHWWKWVAIGLITLLVLPAAALLLLTVRSWLVEN